MKKFVIFVLMFLLPLQAVIGAGQQISHHSLQSTETAHEHTQAQNDLHDSDEATTHCSVEDLCHTHGASVVSQTVSSATETSNLVPAGFLPKKIPTSLPERIDRPQWFPAD